MIDYKCGWCIWWDDKHKRLPKIEDCGFCRKHKPTVLNKEGILTGEWPITDTHDFCGEFRKEEIK